MDFSVSDVDKVLKVFWQCFKEHPNGCAVYISKDARFMNVGRDVTGLVTDFQR